MSKFDVDYFLAKFEAIDEEKWGAGRAASGGRCCAIGLCGAREYPKGEPHIENECWKMTDEARALALLFGSDIEDGVWRIVLINDRVPDRSDKSTPKTRILAALRDLKAKAGAAK